MKFLPNKNQMIIIQDLQMTYKILQRMMHMHMKSRKILQRIGIKDNYFNNVQKKIYIFLKNQRNISQIIKKYHTNI